MRTKAQQEADRKYRAKHPPTEEQRKQARARWIRWYEKNKGYQRSHAAPKPKPNPKTKAPALISAARVRFEEGLDKPKKPECTCNDYRNCTECRNRERVRAFKAGEVPRYRLAVIAQIMANGD
jgi:hypothetical protein